jgi:Ni,Fe-hydrogenase III small subunit
VITRDNRPKLAVRKLASCDGCQLTLLDCEDELLALAGAVQIAHFTEASSTDIAGPYDVSLVEGSVTTERDARRITESRAASRILVTLGACATSGGIQAPAQLRRRRGVHLGGVRATRLHLGAGDLDAGVRSRAGRLRAARLSDRQGPAARAAHRATGGPQARDPRAQRPPRLQALAGGPRWPLISWAFSRRRGR